MPGNVTFSSHLPSKWNAHIDYSKTELSGVTREVSWSTNLNDNKESINLINNFEIFGHSSSIVKCRTSARDGCYF